MTIYTQFELRGWVSPVSADLWGAMEDASAPNPTGTCQRREPHECGDDVEYCERCGGYRPDPHRCDTGSSVPSGRQP